jgi:hypothetical protein
MTKNTSSARLSVVTVLVGVLLLTQLAGCMSTTPEYDKRFGDAVRQSRLQMTINPDAGRTADAALGLDGPSAREALVRYQGSFKTPPPVTNVINIGGSGGGSQ